CAGEGFREIFLLTLQPFRPGAATEEGHLELLVPDWRQPQSLAEVSILVRSPEVGNPRLLGSLSVILGKREEWMAPVPPLEKMELFLRERRKDLITKANIELRPESQLGIAPLVETCDACLKAGFSRIVLGTPPDLERAQKLRRSAMPDKDSLA